MAKYEKRPDKKRYNKRSDAPESERKGPPPMPMRGLAIPLLIMVGFLVLLQLIGGPGKQDETLNYSDFLTKVKKGEVTKVTISHDGANNYYADVETTDAYEKSKKKSKRVEIVFPDGELLKVLDENGVVVEKKRPKTMLISILSNVVPFILIFGIIYFIFIRQMKNAGRGAMSFGKSRAKLLTQDKNRVTFKDVAGVDEAKEELAEVVEFLKDPKQFQRLGGKMPKGVLLSGAPGTGKTLLAKTVAGEADVPFFTISGSDFVEMFVGIGASRVRDMFEQGKKNAPCIIFIDEIDAVGRSRFSGIGGGHDEREQTLNALLVEMDGFDSQEGIIIIAATNRPDVLDPALLRPGRFDRLVVVDLPTLEGREQILKIHTRRIKLSDQVDFNLTARGTSGFSGADLANLVNEAALLAARRQAEFVEQEDMEEARDKVMWGRERRSHVLDVEEKKLTAYHEAGHALAMYFTPECEPIHKVTIIPRGRALGATLWLPEKDRYTQSKKRLEGQLVAMMGGRAAEELIFGDVTTGAHNDIQRATATARNMVCEYGMSEELGPQNFGSNDEMLFFGREVNRTQDHSEETAKKIDQAIHRILTEAYAKTMKILTDNKDKLIALSELLIEREVLDFSEVESILKTGKITEKPGVPIAKVVEPETTEKGPEPTGLVEKKEDAESPASDAERPT